MGVTVGICVFTLQPLLQHHRNPEVRQRDVSHEVTSFILQESRFFPTSLRQFDLSLCSAVAAAAGY
jgi:hypothetical protein